MKPDPDNDLEDWVESEDIPVTIIVAISTPTGIVMAADGQITAGNTKLPATTKLFPVKFKNGYALVGEAGNTGLSGRSLQEMGSMAKGAMILNERTVPKTALAAMQVVRRELRARNFECSIGELNRQIKDQGDCHWLVGYMFGLKSALFHVCMSSGSTTPILSPHAAIGTGRQLAEYLLAHVTWPGMNIVEAEMAATYVVEEVKKFDLHCSGQTQVAFVGPSIAIEDEVRRVRGLIRDAAITDKMIKEAFLRITRSRFEWTMQDFASAMRELSRYVKRHPSAKHMTMGQISRKIDAERIKSGKGKMPARGIADRMKAFPPYIVRLLAAKNVTANE